MTRKTAKSREQVQLLSPDDLVPANRFARKLEAALDGNFICGTVEDKYSDEIGRPGIDPVSHTMMELSLEIMRQNWYAKRGFAILIRNIARDVNCVSNCMPPPAASIP